MARNFGAVLSNDFETPAVRSKLDAMLLLVMATRQFVVELSKATDIEGKPRWHEILAILAERIASQIPKLTEPRESLLIWKQFTSDLSIASLKSHAAHVVGRTEELLTNLERNLAGNNSGLCLNYLTDANAVAAQRVAEMEVHRLGRPRAQTLPVKLAIHYDPKSEQSQASSARGIDEIRWNFQVEEFSLWGALVADRVFEHEYFCHLLPVNTHLSAEIREGFLDGVLQFEHSLLTSTGTAQAVAESRWNYVLHRFRDDLWDYFEEAADEDELKLRNLAQAPQRSGLHKWQLVREVIECQEGADNARLLKEKLLRL